MTRDENRPRRNGAPRRPKRDGTQHAPEDKRPSPVAPKPRESASAQVRQRIAKLMARAGLCSRRDAEAWILDGRVSVNGTVLTSPALDVGPQDVILVDGAPLPEPEMTRLFLFHKPRGLVTSDFDPEGRPTVADFLRDHWPEGPRTVTVGRLDINTEGLLLLTNDGGLARVLELPSTGWVRRYRVRAKGETDQGKLDALVAGISIDGVDYVGIEAKLDRIQGSNCWLTMGLREGKNREIKRVLEHIGLEVNRLIRLSFGPFQLLDLPEGAVEEVRTRVLRDQLGATFAAAAGVDLGETVEAPVVKPPNRDERPKRGDTRARDDKRGGERPLQRGREPDPALPPPIRERPQGGPRRHVAALRTDAQDGRRNGPRQRIERSETADRKSRTVRVERLVPAREEKPPRRRDGDRPGGHHDRPPKRGHASPSAIGKRERMARSGGRDEPRGEREGRPVARKSRDAAPRFDRGDERRGARERRNDDRPDGKRSPPRSGPGESPRRPGKRAPNKGAPGKGTSSRGPRGPAKPRR